MYFFLYIFYLKTINWDDFSLISDRSRCIIDLKNLSIDNQDFLILIHSDKINIEGIFCYECTVICKEKPPLYLNSLSVKINDYYCINLLIKIDDEIIKNLQPTPFKINKAILKEETDPKKKFGSILTNNFQPGIFLNTTFYNDYKILILNPISILYLIFIILVGLLFYWKYISLIPEDCEKRNLVIFNFNQSI